MILAEVIAADDDVRELLRLAVALASVGDHVLTQPLQDYAEALGIAGAPEPDRLDTLEGGVEADIGGCRVRLAPVLDSGDLPAHLRQRFAASGYRTWLLVRREPAAATLGFIAAAEGNPAPPGCVSS